MPGSKQLFRLLSILEAFILLAAAWIYAGGFAVAGFALMLGAYHWTTLAVIGFCAVAAIASVVLAIMLFMKPRSNLMTFGAVLIAPAVILISSACLVGSKCTAL